MIKGRDVLIYLSYKNNGDFDLIYADIKARITLDEDEVARVVNNLVSRYDKIITILDEEYPKCFNNSRPPFVLYLRGNTALLNSKKKRLGIECKGNGKHITTTAKNIIKDLSNDYIYITENTKYILDDKKEIISFVPYRVDLISCFDDKLLFISEIPNTMDGQDTTEQRTETSRLVGCYCDSLLITYLENDFIKESAVRFAQLDFKQMWAVPIDFAESKKYHIANNCLIDECCDVLTDLNDIYYNL